MPKAISKIEVAPVMPPRKVTRVGSLADAIYVADKGELPFTSNKRLQAAIDSIGIDRALVEH